MNKSIIPDAKHQELNLAFQFESLLDKLSIKAQSNDGVFQGQIESNPNIDFEQLKEMIMAKQFKVVQKTPEVLKIKMGFLQIELKNNQKMLLSNMQQAVTQLKKDLSVQTYKNAQNEETIKCLRQQVDQMTTKFAVINQKLSLMIDQSEKSQQNANIELDNLKNRVRQSEQKADELEKNNDQVEGQVNQLRKSVEEQRRKIIGLEETNQIIINGKNKLQHLVKSLQVNSKQPNHSVQITNPSLSQQSNPIPNQKPSNQPIPIPKSQKQPEQPSDAVVSASSSSTNPSKIALSEINNHSKIAIQSEETQKIKNFFNRSIKSVNLLYRASQNSFLTEKFHQNCNNIPNTLILCQTEFNKKIGGFTPLTWESPENWSRKIDESQQSFIFSLTHNDKFLLKEKDWAIQNSKKGGPTFGYGFGDLSIRDQANTEKVSYSYINKYYQNENYKYDDKDSFERFNGNPGSSGYFKVIDWEVWQVEFQE